MATVATISVNFAQYDVNSFTSVGVIDKSINPKTLAQYCLGTFSGDLSYMGGFVKKTGDSISGNLEMGVNPIFSSFVPSINTHLTNKLYVDTIVNSLSSASDSSFVKLAGSTMSGHLTLCCDPTLPNHAVTKNYVDGFTVSKLTALDNSITITGGVNGRGELYIKANTTSTTGLVTKDYVDSAIAAIVPGVTKSYVDLQDATKVSKAGDTMTGFLTLNQNPVSNLHAATKSYVDEKVNSIVIPSGGGDVTKAYVDFQDSSKVSKAGDAMTGFLTLNQNPVSNLHAATKSYVDGVFSSAATISYVDSKFASIGSSITKAYVDSQDATKVSKAGDTMTGSLLVQGTITATGDITAFSDKRLKRDINPILDSLDKVLKMKGVSFERLSDNKKSIGLIAQDVFEIIPEVVNESEDGYLSLAYSNIVAVLIEAIKELNVKIENLKAEK